MTIVYSVDNFYSNTQSSLFTKFFLFIKTKVQNWSFPRGVNPLFGYQRPIVGSDWLKPIPNFKSLFNEFPSSKFKLKIAKLFSFSWKNTREVQKELHGKYDARKCTRISGILWNMIRTHFEIFWKKLEDGKSIWDFENAFHAIKCIYAIPITHLWPSEAP